MMKKSIVMTKLSLIFYNSLNNLDFKLNLIPHNIKSKYQPEGNLVKPNKNTSFFSILPFLHSSLSPKLFKWANKIFPKPCFQLDIYAYCFFYILPLDFAR